MDGLDRDGGNAMYGHVIRVPPGQGAVDPASQQIEYRLAAGPGACQHYRAGARPSVTCARRVPPGPVTSMTTVRPGRSVASAAATSSADAVG